MRGMDVADFESGTIARETTRSQRRKPTLVRQLGQRIRLIHKLRELRAAKEISNHGAECLRIDQLLRRHAVDVDVKQRHALLHQPLGASQADAALVGQQFAHRADTPAAQVINVVQSAFAATQIN